MNRYYLTQRPPSIGTFPNSKNNKPTKVESFVSKITIQEIDKECWGYVEYKEPLTNKEISDYELIEEVNAYLLNTTI